MRVLICGDRHWTDVTPIRREMVTLPEGSVVIHGAARGVDTVAGLLAKSLGYAVESYQAEWNRYGRAAGPIRNQQMLDQGKPDVVWAFHPDIAHSRGTADMVRRAVAAGLPVIVFDR